MCMQEYVSSECVSCICTLSCSLFGTDSTICKLCKGSETAPAEVSVEDLWAPSCYGCNPPPPKQYKCPVGWSISQDQDAIPRCFKVIDLTKSGYQGSWIVGQNTSCPGHGPEAQLAVADTEEKINAIEDAISNFPGDVVQSWIAARQSATIFNWVPRSGSPFPVGASRNFMTGCPKPSITESCLYVQTGGGWCNDKCGKLKTVVCEQPAFLS